MNPRNWTRKLFSSSIGTSAARLNGPIEDIVPLMYMTGAPIAAPSVLITIEWETMLVTCLNVAVPPSSALKMTK